MNIKKINKRLEKNTGGRVCATYRDGCIVLEGQLDNWEEIVNACYTAAQRYSKTHVVNDIKLTTAKIPPIRLPVVSDESLEGSKWDILVVGGGISGTSIARELSKWDLDILLVDKEPDFAMQASGRNDGEVHPGVDLSKGPLKQQYVLKGNRIFDKVCHELSVPFERKGQYVGFTQGWVYPIILLYAWKKRRFDGVIDTKVLNKKELQKAHGKLNPEFRLALYNPSAGSVCPYGLTIAYAENAVANGVKASLNTAVLDIAVQDNEIISVTTNRGKVYPKVVINAAGVFAEEIARMANDRFFSIHPRKGTDLIFDKKAGNLFTGIASIKDLSLKRSHTKGGGIVHTVHGNLLVGPDAKETYEKEVISTQHESVKKIFEKQKRTIPELSERDIITYFTGVRAPTFEEDFIIEKGRKTRNIIHCAGIQSPGLTCAPVVALDVEKMAVEMLSSGSVVKRNESFNPRREGIPVLREMPSAERAALIGKNPDYGIIVCRCEEVSKGEILDALRSPICVPTVDAVKKRVRPGMGRCQGGFCSPLVIGIIADYLGVPQSEVKKSYDDSVITYGETKKAQSEAGE
ncbi:MAG: Hydrogen cyanide synthase subunit HcnC precursor [Firmicutes bacterium ADurb.Bin300]|nr:MAG: Hydrogen cyanide synthase subunit HcnC precursor [Firmicutes bacterium ADurb.Bin300]